MSQSRCPSSACPSPACPNSSNLPTTYLSSQSFHVKCDNHLSSLYSSSCGVSHGCSWSFAFRHVHHFLSTLISSLSLNHHLYADDSQLFFSFHPPDFDWNITHLQNALQQISSWMTANHLTLSSCRAEFLLIGLSEQLAKIHNSSISTIHSDPSPLIDNIWAVMFVWR